MNRREFGLASALSLTARAFDLGAPPRRAPPDPKWRTADLPKDHWGVYSPGCDLIAVLAVVDRFPIRPYGLVLSPDGTVRERTYTAGGVLEVGCPNRDWVWGCDESCMGKLRNWRLHLGSYLTMFRFPSGEEWQLDGVTTITFVHPDGPQGRVARLLFHCLPSGGFGRVGD